MTGLMASAGLFLLPAACTLATGLYGVGERQMWRDEFYAWWASTLPMPELGKVVRHKDIVLLPYYLFMHLWIGLFGASPAALRAPSAIAMAGAAGLMALLGRRLFTTRTGLLAGLLFAVVPNVTRYGQEARPYGFAVLAAVLSTFLLTRALDGPSRRKWGAYVASIVLLAWTNMVALSVLGGHLAAMLVARHQAGRSPARGFTASLIIGEVLAAPVLVMGAGQRGQIAWNNWTTADFHTYIWSLLGSRYLAEAIMLLGVMGLVAARRHAALLGVWALLPPLVTSATQDQFHLYNMRYLMFTIPAWVLLAAVAVLHVGDLLTDRIGAGVPRRVVGWLLAASVVATAGYLAVPDIRQARADIAGEPDFRGAAQLILRDQRPGDGVGYNLRDSPERRFMSYYLPGFPASPGDVFLNRTAQQLGTRTSVGCPDLQECAADTTRLWLVTGVSTPDPFSALTPATARMLRSQFRVVGTNQFRHLRVVLLQRVHPAR